ncbi:chondroitin AC/alginate lyase [Pholiota molesta]|nr:chondroitin AC/alginate lyase [Pholiota molesta]
MAAADYNPLDNNAYQRSPYGTNDPNYHESAGYIAPLPRKKPLSKWIKIGVPLLVIVIAAAVVGGIVGSRKSKDASASSSNGGSSGSAGDTAAASSAISAKMSNGRFATATDSEFMVPVYPSTTNAALFTTPTFLSSSNANIAWPADPFQPANPSPTNVRTDRPRLIAPAYNMERYYLWKCHCLFQLAPVAYHMDGDSGILDNAREVKMRIKAFAYVFRMTNDTKWVDRAFVELQNAAGNGTTPFGPDVDKWNSVHFLDTAEFSAAFGIAYDWLHDMWSDEQKSQIRTSLIQYGLQLGLAVFTPGASYGWWSQSSITGNWNCVCNGGLTLASLAILGDDTTGIAEQLLSFTINNAKSACINAVSPDGTWAETANYWYFGTTAHAEMSSSLITATGSDYGLLDTNSNFGLTGQFHMYAYGPTSLFNYGDHGPNKFSTTANSLFLYGQHYKHPNYALFQREQADAAEPWSMFWYDPTVSGAFWDGAPLDTFFDNGSDQWASMRSSWTDQHALFLAMKAGMNQGHQTHNDLDAGDFVLDALGTRWAGELGSGDYLSPEYFNSDAQNATRWEYYRKMTEGQNTILINKSNQNVLAAPTVQHGSSNTTQGSSTVINIPSDSTAFWVADLSSAYFDATSVKRGGRLLNARRQVLIQDEITASADVQWRMHTNATVSVDSSGTSATLTLDGQTMLVSMVSPPSGAAFTTSAAVRFASDVTPPVPDQANPGVTVLIIDLPAGTYTLQVLFNPQWPGMSASDFVTPPTVALDSWSLTSHN